MIPLAAAATLHDAGAKARTLARALAAGLPVLGGFVVLPGEEVDAAELAQALGRLGGERFAVRSSATVEDLPGASAAGVFESVVGVRADEVEAAIEQVRGAVGRQAARAYLGARGLLGHRLEMAVLVQPLALAARLGVLHTAPLDEGCYAAEEREAGEPEYGQVTPRRVRVDESLGRIAARLGALLGGEVDVEYALGADGPIVLQARPLTAPPPRRDPTRWLVVESSGVPSGAAGGAAHEPADHAPTSYLLDDEHNPQPLSAAQCSLVERLERLPRLSHQRVIHGWLYVRQPAAAAPDAAPAPAIPDDERDAGALLARSIVPRAEALLGPLEAEAAPPLDAALGAFDEVARLHGAELRPVLRRARLRLDLLLQRSIGARLVEHGDLLGGTGGRTQARDLSLWLLGRADDDERRARLLAEHLAAFGAYAPAWDVAVAPDDEEPERVRRAAALLARAESPERRHVEAVARAGAAERRLVDRLTLSGQPEEARALEALLPSVRAAMQAAEDDDALFFRAQRLVRRALLDHGRRAAAAGRLDAAWQIFDLPIEEVERGELDAGRAHLARARRESQARLSPPSRIHDGVPTWHGGGGGEVLVGQGTGGRGYGRALVVRDATHLPEQLVRGAVLVLPAVLPSLTWLLPPATALVTDVGGALSHAATLAREYGIPAVLGTGSATRTIADGDDLIVDGDHGRVYRLGG